MSVSFKRSGVTLTINKLPKRPKLPKTKRPAVRKQHG